MNERSVLLQLPSWSTCSQSQLRLPISCCPMRIIQKYWSSEVSNIKIFWSLHGKTLGWVCQLPIFKYPYPPPYLTTPGYSYKPLILSMPSLESLHGMDYTAAKVYGKCKMTWDTKPCWYFSSVFQTCLKMLRMENYFQFPFQFWVNSNRVRIALLFRAALCRFDPADRKREACRGLLQHPTFIACVY